VPIDKCNTEYDKNLTFKILTALFNFYLPLFAMICINTKIYVVIRKRYINPCLRYSSSQSNFDLLKINNNIVEHGGCNSNLPESENLLHQNSSCDNFRSILSQNNSPQCSGGAPTRQQRVKDFYKSSKSGKQISFKGIDYLVDAQDLGNLSPVFLKPDDNPVIKVNSISNNSDLSSNISKNRLRSNNLISLKNKVKTLN